MHIAVLCPQCQSRYQLDPSLLGKRMRCPNSICRAVFEVRAEGEPAPPPQQPEAAEKAPPKPPVSGSVGDFVQILAAEAVSPVSEEKPPATSPSWQEVPPVRVPTSRSEATSPTVEPVPPRTEPAPPKIGPAVPKPAPRMEPALRSTKPAKAPPQPPTPSEAPAPPPPAPPPPDLPPADLLPDDLFGDAAAALPKDDAAREPAPGEPLLQENIDQDAWDEPRELASANWATPPPVRASGLSILEAPAAQETVPALATTPAAEMPAAPRARRRSLLVIVLMLAVLGGVLTGGFLLLQGRHEVNEEERYKQAHALYQQRDFAEAATALQELARAFPASTKRKHYRFLAELSDVREAAHGPVERPEERIGALDRVLQFLEIYKNDPLLKDYHGDIWQTLQRLAKDLTTLAEEKHDPGNLKRAQRAWSEAGKFQPPTSVNVAEAERVFAEDFARAQKVLAVRAQRLEVVEVLQGLIGQASADAVREGRALARTAGLEADPDIAPLLEKLVEAHRASLKFTPQVWSETPTLPAEDRIPSFFVAPAVGKTLPVPKESGVVLAQARGVLYALEPERGQVRWVRRVGVDTSLLPLRVPASTVAPELVLVLSTDSKTLTGVEALTGAVLWQHTLGDVCVGQPVLVDRHVFVPTLSGTVEEIETTQGRLQGYYALGQPLTAGGVRQPGTSLVVFPAESFCIYVLDVAKRECAAVLYTQHAPGSLRGAPLVWNEPRSGGDKTKNEGWLLLNLAGAGDEAELRPYSLPITQPDQKPTPSVKVRGRSWTSPWHDGDKLALATDAGRLSLLGIRQKGNRDPLLFPLLQDDYVVENEDRARLARAMLVHADADNYWVLTGGRLHRLQRTFTAQAGPGLLARWPQPVEVGSPLHAGQVQVTQDGATILYVVSQDMGQPTCWARAIDAEHGKVLWQRQLGLVCAGQPVAAQGAILCPDARELFLFEAAKFPSDKNLSWQEQGKVLAGAGSLQFTMARPQGFVHLAWGPEPAPKLDIVQVDAKGESSIKTFALPAPPQGTPALGSDFALVPLANGIVMRLPLGDGTPVNGPDWRGVGVDESQPGHVLALGNNQFALTDGGRKVMRLQWGEAKLWSPQESAELPHRIVAAPAVLKGKLLLADASDTVTLLEGERLQVARRWSLGGKITAGPFVRGDGFGSVVGKKRLVWMDPAKEQPLWEYTFVGQVVGQPEVVDGLLIVADLTGAITALDPASGRPAGPGYRLRANVAPSATPLPFGPGRVWLPLTDGTGIVLPLAILRNQQ